ncbi:FxsA family protein [Nocardioides sp. cx-169]|uniref:FxsA family protein n=1 Tax=Nocardioides sp. cx-169 TaxID=2899080 RepID=UPI001E5E9EE6|nr:FxsA family protein [Nocardioides sp. cx-169]MCD4535344.1 FxsA family protein [Nocardioides sp. cx-169]
MSPRRSRLGWVLVLALVVVPLLELYVLIQVGQVIGAWWTILLLVAASILGGWLIRREGARAWRALNGAIGTGTMPTRELADGALILIGGTLMLSPGFVTDAFGILLILPVTRPVFRRLLTAFVARRVLVVSTRRPPGGTAPRGPGSAGGGPGGSGGPGDVVQGDVIDPPPR